MSSNSFTKENLDTYLKELAKEFRRLNGKSMPAEIVLVGGAAILTNYGFRDMTTDIDAVIHAASSMKDAINMVGDKFVRTIAAEYLIAMKLRSGRKYKNDLSDVIGILAEHEKKGAPITLKKIDAAVTNLYGGWDAFPKDSKPFIEDALKNGDFENVYTSVKKDEIESKDILIGFEKNYPKVAKESNINDILKTLKEKRNNQ